MPPSLTRHLLIGATSGAIPGAAFALWVISIADCGGPNCAWERVLGVVGHSVVGAALGAVIGALVYLARR